MSPAKRHIVRAPSYWLVMTLIFCGTALGSLQTSAKPSSSSAAQPATPTPSLNADSVIQREHRIKRSTDGLFYLKGKIDGVPVNFAVDTGATVVVLNARDGNRIGFDAAPGNSHRIRTASGYSGMSWHQVDNLNIAGTSIGSVKIAIMQNGPNVSLLGLNALSRLASVTMIDDELIIRFK